MLYLVIEKVMLGLRLLQFPSGRFAKVEEYCQQDAQHPNFLENPKTCEDETCIQCIGLEKCRAFVDECYQAQHQENDSDTLQGLCFIFDCLLK